MTATKFQQIPTDSIMFVVGYSYCYVGLVASDAGLVVIVVTLSFFILAVLVVAFSVVSDSHVFFTLCCFRHFTLLASFYCVCVFNFALIRSFYDE